ncbi:MAG: ATP-binding protein, partial [Patulibacter sp.]
VRGSADALRRELDATMRELRELVRGVLPAALVERGLGAAADELADRMPLPTTVEAGDERYPTTVESALWFVISEALANVAKHADADRAAVLVVRTREGVRIEVRDDGRGGATPVRRPDGGGSGLRGIADRVDVLGGHLTVDSPPGGGTRIVAEVPCAS